MPRSSAVLVSLCLCAAMCSSGCTTLRQTWNNVFELHDPDDPEAGGDQWAVAGKEGRGNRRMEKEDPLDRLLWSQKARDINRNVGIE